MPWIAKWETKEAKERTEKAELASSAEKTAISPENARTKTKDHYATAAENPDTSLAIAPRHRILMIVSLLIVLYYVRQLIDIHFIIEFQKEIAQL